MKKGIFFIICLCMFSTLSAQLNKPTPTTPTSGTNMTNMSTTLKWGSISGATFYRLQYDTCASFNSPILTDTNITTVSFSPANLHYGATYYWRVRACNSGDNSLWSVVWTFTTPGTFALSSPNDSIVISSLSYTVAWKPLSGSTGYQVEYDTTPTFNSPALQYVVKSSTATSGTVSTTITNLRYGKMHYWRVRAYRACDTSDWSVSRRIIVSNCNASSPADNSVLTSMSIYLYGTSISGTTSYEFEYDTTATLDSPEFVHVSNNSYSYNMPQLHFGTDYYWRVRACSVNDTTAWSAIRKFTTPSSVTLSSPNNGASNANVNSITLQWTSLSNVSGYEYQCAPNNLFTVITNHGYTTTTSSTINPLQYGYNYWRVRAYNSVDTSDWSSARYFSTPSTPSLSYPAYGATLTSVYSTFTCTAISGSKGYMFECDTTTSFNSQLHQSVDTTTTTCKIYGLHYNRTYYWRARARNNVDTSSWSSSRTFYTPDRVTLSSPINGDTITTITPQLYWSSINGSSHYICELDTTPLFNSPLYLRDSCPSYYFYANELHYGTTYYWRVKAFSSNDSSLWSSVYFFTTPKDGITLTAPANNSYLSNLNYFSTNFTWTGINGSAYYDCEFDTDPSFTSQDFHRDSVATTSFVPGDYLHFGKWNYWRVRARNEVDSSLYSNHWRFYTPSYVTLTSPDNAYTYTNTIRPSMSCTNFRGNIKYEYECDTTTLFNSPLHVKGSKTSYSFTIDSTLHYGKKYYWHIRAYNLADTSAWSTTRYFTTPYSVTLSSPNNGTLLANSSATSTTLKWASINGSILYQYELDTNSSFNSPRYVTDTLPTNSIVTPNLIFGKTYYWRVRAFSAVDTSDWSDTRTFKAGHFGLSTPQNGATGVSTSTVYFNWSRVDPGNTLTYYYYYYYYGTNPNSLYSSGSRKFYYSGYNQTTDSGHPDLKYGTRYYWKVYYSNGGWYSDIWSFTTDTIRQIFPADGDTLTRIGVALRWNNPGRYYHYECDTTPTFDSPLYMSGDSILLDSASLSCLRYNTTYYWRVMATNNYPDTSGWTTIWKFTTPNGVTPISPIDHDTIASLSTQLKWSGCYGGTYQYQYDTLPDFSSPYCVTSTTSNTSITASNLHFKTYYWRVRNRNSCDTSDWTPTQQFTIACNINLLSIADSTHLTGLSTSVSWSKTMSLLNYLVQYDTVADYSSSIMKYQAASTSSYYSTITTTLSNLYYGRTYHWHVAIRNNGDTSNYSVSRCFFTPKTINLNSPADNSHVTTLNPALGWSTINGSSGYQYQCDTTLNFDSQLYVTGYSAGNSNTASGLHYGTTYYWQARAYTSYDTSAWSSTWQFTTPAAVTLISPADNSSINSVGPTLTWDDIEGSTRYQYQYDTVSSFNSPNLYTANSYSNYCYPYNLYYGTTYYWRVRAISNGVDTSDWSPVWNFTTPTAVTLLVPADNSVLNTLSTNLTWDNIEGTNRYQYEYDTVPTFNSSELVSNFTSANPYTATDLHFGTTYYWRVRSCHYADTSAWSPTWQFTTPNGVTPTAPADNSNLNSTSEYLYWTGLEGCTGYAYQYDTTLSFNSGELVSGTRANNYNYILTDELLYGTTYYWRLRAYNESDTSNWTTPWQFTTPAAVTLTSPTDSLALNALNTTFTWNDILGTSYYDYRYDTVATFNSPLLITGLTSNYSQASNTLYYGATYYWQVRAHNSHDISNWSPAWQFTTPAYVNLTTPTNNSTQNTNSVTLYWNGITGSTKYEYRCDTTLAFNSSRLRTGSTSNLYSSTLYNLYYGAMHYWQVRAISSVDTSDWAPAFQFEINPQLAAATLYHPYYNSTGVNFNTVNFQWYSVADATSYQLLYTTDSTFGTYTAINNISYTSTSVANLNRYTTYYWKVKALNSYGQSDWSPTWHFTTDKEYIFHHDTLDFCDTYLLNGHVIGASGTFYVDTVTLGPDLDSISVLHLRAHYSAHTTENASACEFYDWRGTHYTISGTYNDTLQRENGCDSIITLQLTIYHTQANVSYDADNGTLTCLSTNVDYQWLNCDSNYTAIDNATIIVFTPETSGHYAVAIVEGGICRDTSDCVEVITVGIEDANLSSEIQLYPNPTNGKVYLQNTFNQVIEYQIYDIYGQLLWKENSHDNSMEIDLTNYPNGLYLIKIYDGKQMIKMGKVIKESL